MRHFLSCSHFAFTFQELTTNVPQTVLFLKAPYKIQKANAEMAEGGDTDIVTCSVCFEPYEAVGKHVPRILPCHHTLCEECVGGLLRKNYQQVVTCPECRKKHLAGTQPTSFPQNKYVVSYIMKMKTLAEEKDRIEKCSEHGKEAGLYCRNEECQIPICQTCLLTGHKSHDFGDINEERSLKKDSLLEMTKLTDQHLRIQKQRLTFAQSEIERHNSRCVTRLETTKKEVIKKVTDKFEEMIRLAKLPFTILTEEVKELNGQLAALNPIEEDSKKFEKIGNICKKLEKMAKKEGKVRAKLDDERKYDFVEYSTVNLGILGSLCGELRVKQKAVGFDTIKGQLIFGCFSKVGRTKQGKLTSECIRTLVVILNQSLLTWNWLLVR